MRGKKHEKEVLEMRGKNNKLQRLIDETRKKENMTQQAQINKEGNKKMKHNKKKK